MQSIITNNINAITEACKTHAVRSLYVFGSAVRDDFSDESDVDFIAEFNLIRDHDNFETVERFYENKDHFQEKLMALLERDVDLLMESSIKNKYLRHFINQEKQLIYAEA